MADYSGGLLSVPGQTPDQLATGTIAPGIDLQSILGPLDSIELAGLLVPREIPVGGVEDFDNCIVVFN